MTASESLLETLLKKTVSFVWVLHRKLFVSLVVSLAIVLIASHAIAYYLEKNSHVLEELVESQLQNKVTFDKIDVGIHLLFPSVSMNNFTIQSGTEEKILAFDSAGVRLNIPQSILSGQIIIDTLFLRGFNALVHRNKNNEISIAEFQLSNATKNNSASSQTLQSFLSILKQTNLIISESKILFVDEMKIIPTVFVSDISLKMKNNNERHQISLSAKLNESETLLDFRLDFNGKIDEIAHWDGKVYAAVDNLNHHTLLHFLQKDVLQIEEFQLNNVKADAKVWSTIDRGKLQSIHGELLVENTSLKRVDNDRSIHFDTLSTNFKFERKQTQTQISGVKTNHEAVKNETIWLLDLYGLNLTAESQKISEKYLSLKINKDEDKPVSEAQIFIDKLEFSEFSHIISFFAPQNFSDNIYSYLKPRGSLENIIAKFKFNTAEMPIDIQHYQVQTDINDFAMNAILSLPKIRHLSAQLVFNESMGQAIINSSDMKLNLKSLFRNSWLFSELKGNVFWQKEGSEWFLGAEKLLIKSPDFAALNANLNLWIAPRGQLFMDLTAFYENVNVEAIHKYVPAKVMNEGLVEWLDRALISGRVPDGGIVFRGKLNEFPYTQHNGNMDIVFNTENVLLEYLHEWPRLSEINAQVQFTQKGMLVEGQHSKIFSAQSDNVRVDLDDYLQRILLIQGDIKSGLDDGLKFLQQSKLVSDNVIDMIDATGDIDIKLNLKIPLLAGNGKPDLKTRIRLNNTDYYPPGFDRKDGLVSHVKGDIIIHNQDINAKKLSAKIMGQSAKVIIKTAKRSSKSTRDPDISINIDSKISMTQVRKYNLMPKLLLPLSDQLSGTGNIKLNIKLPNAQRGLSFNIDSNLKNIRSKLPAPFNKSAKEIFPFSMSFSETKPSGKNNNNNTVLLKVSYAKLLSLALLLDRTLNTDGLELLKGSLAFEGDEAKLPEKNILRISGALKQLPLEQWQSVFNLSPDDVNKSQKENTPPVKNRFIPIEIAMTELVLPELQFARHDTDKSKKSMAGKTKADSSPGPEYFPLLNGYINSLKLGNIDLGRFSIQSSRVGKAIIFDAITLEGAFFSFNSKGKWHHWNSSPEVDMEGRFETASLEKVLIAFGYDQLIRQGKTQASGYLSWPGGLSDFSKETMKAKLNIEVEKGAWIEGKPGPAGRMLGLLNMNAFSRRLSLDFSDFSHEGFEFDKIEGDFRFKNAVVYTDNLQIYSPSAKVLLTGHTELLTEKFDQRVTVIPEVSATLPIAGAAVAGPAGAAVVWLGQKLLGSQLNKITAYDYTIKGNWDNPVIKKDKTSKNTLNNIKKLFKLADDKSIDEDENLIFDINTSELP